MKESLIRDAILRVGEVSGIDGRKVFISVDKNKNSSDLLFEKEIIKNVAVGGYIEIRKGFLSIIGKVDGEKLQEETHWTQTIDKNKRVLTISLAGYIGYDGKFVGGIKELPLIGNEAFILTNEKILRIHNLLKSRSSLSISIAKTAIEEMPIDFPIDGLFNSHIAIFGNTGSGKSNTLASLYQELFNLLGQEKLFKTNCRFFLLDFNGEYNKASCITSKKNCYNLSTRENLGDRIPISIDDFFDVETLSVLVEATDKTQKPFLRRTLRFYKKAKKADVFSSYLKAIIQNIIKEILQMANKDVAFQLLDYMEEVLGLFMTEDEKQELRSDIEFHNTNHCFFKKEPTTYFNTNAEAIDDTNLYKSANAITPESLEALSALQHFDIFMHLQLITDLYRYKVHNDHIYPVINRFKSKQLNIEKTFQIQDNPDFWKVHNFVVINLRDVNLDMRKTIPLLLAKNIYNAHKKEKNKKTLNIIIDEAHNILSTASFRETDEWKDYRLETFEEIIKEGRKFGVFVTIASQRPNDISETIISQAHNYFIHQLINQKDLLMIGKAISYIDKITEESIPTLSVGTCIFSGIATPMPLKLKIEELPNDRKPDSHTLQFDDVTKEKSKAD